MSQRPRPDEDALSTWRPIGTRPRSAYVHIPFCRHRCGYCNFSLVANRDYLVERFLNALEIEIGWLTETYELDTLFLGGGTPSHLSPGNLARLRSILDSRFAITDQTEVTAECNPNDLDLPKADAFAQIGVNRISLGVQSLNPEKLVRLERDHTPEQVFQAIQQARRFARSVSLDLIFAAPDETLEAWRTDLEQAVALEPDHVSTYELTYEKGTTFWNRLSQGVLRSSEEDDRADMYLLAIETLSAAGLQAYEISSFAKPGSECRHNKTYWNGQPYFAFGPGASRYVNGIRETNHQSTLQYLKRIETGQSPVFFAEQLSPEDSARELLAIGLRRVAGVNAEDFFRLTGFQIEQLLGRVSDDWMTAGLLQHEPPNWRLTIRGRMMCDQISAEIVER